MHALAGQGTQRLCWAPLRMHCSCDSQPCGPLQDKLLKLTVARMQAQQSDSAYAGMLGLILAQFDGLVAGYTARQQQVNDSSRLPPLSKQDFLFVNGNGGWRQ